MGFQAGVRILVAGGNSGTSDWRKGPDAVKTGDLVFPWSFRTLNRYKGLPGTRYEAVFGSPGDAINPILARYLGIEMLYYHIVTNIGQGLSRGSDKIEHKGKIMYSPVHSEMCLKLELDLLGSVELAQE